MIYCVEDDGNIRELIIYTLHTTGFKAYGFVDSVEFYEKMEEELPALILLDIMLPKKDGLTILDELKKSSRNKHIPVILTTAKDSEFDKVKGLDLGADDYITKPFGMMELVSRIKAVLRRCAPQEKKIELHLGDIYLNNSERTVRVGKSEIILSFKEFELLKLLMENPELVFSRDNLLNSVWGYEYLGESRTVDVHIRTLRQKLGEASKAIQTIRNVGYKMCK